MPPRFIYFDLGNVLFLFDNDVLARQVADVSGLPVQRIRDVVVSGLAEPFERGEIDARQFYEIFCEQTNTRPDYDLLKKAASEIFSLNVRMMPLVAALQRSGRRMGILSNTNCLHWQLLSSGRFAIIPALFERFALSFEIGAMKPEREIYTAAAEMAGVAPEEIFFTDDRPENVQGALDAGFDATIFTSPAALADDLRNRGLAFNF